MNCLLGQIKLVFQALTAVICMQILMAERCAGQSYSFINRREKDKVRFSLIKNLVVIPMYLNDKGPFNFVVDTGVSLMLITDPKLADSLNMTNKRTIKIQGYGGGQEMEATVSSDISAAIGKLRLWDVPSAALKTDLMDLSSYLGIKVTGLIGYPLFKDLVVRINYATKMLSFQSAYLGLKRPGEAVSLELIENKPFVQARINNGKEDVEVKLILDNGASHALSLEAYNSGPFPLPEKTIPANLGVGLGGKVTGSIGRIKSVSLGSFSFKEVLTSFPDYEDVGARSLRKDRHGNLGSDFMRHFNVTFDYFNSVMYLKKNAYFKDAFEHDMSGLEIYHDEVHTKGYFISRVELNSPAEKAGLLPDDQIVAINFKPAHAFSLDEMCSLLKSKPGQQFIFEIYRDGERLIKVFKLEKRI